MEDCSHELSIGFEVLISTHFSSITQLSWHNANFHHEPVPLVRGWSQSMEGVVIHLYLLRVGGGLCFAW